MLSKERLLTAFAENKVIDSSIKKKGEKEVRA